MYWYWPTAIGPAGQTQGGPTILFATSSTAFNGLTASTTITATTNTITFANTLAGLLTAGGGGTGISNPSAAGVLLGSYAGGSYQQLATSSLGLLTTNVAEGSNLYYLDSRVQSFVHGSTTIPKTYTANTFTGAQIFSGGVTIGSLNGPLDARNGVVGATSTIGVLYGGTGLTSAPTLGQILVGNASSGYTLSATSTLNIALSDTTGVLAVNRGGTNITNPSAAGILLGSYAGGSYQQLATSSLGLLTTNVAEGSNLYYLDTRVQSFVHGSTTIPKTYTANTFTNTNVFNANVGIGTSTPNWALEVAGTRPTLALSDTGSGGANLKHWLFSNQGGNLYIGTSTDLFGTSTPAALILLNNGNIGIGTSSPAQVLSITGNGYLTGGLGVGVATTTAGVLQNTGNAYHGGLVISTGAGTSTFSGALQSTYLNLTGTSATSTFSNGISLSNGCYAIGTTCIGNGITSIGPTGQTQTGPGIILATSSTAFNGLTASTTITATTNTITFANTLAGLLTAGGGGTGISNPSAGGVLLGSYAGGSYQQLATSSLGLLTTNVAEGSNLYYLDSRVQSFVHGSTTIPKTYTSNTFTAANNFTSTLALGSTTPFGVLAVNPTGGQASNEFVVGSSSATAFIINNNGNVGIVGTTTAAQVFSVVGNGYITGGLGVGVATTSAGVLQSSGNIYSAGLALFTGAGTSTFNGIQGTYLNLTGASATSTATDGFNITNGCYAIGTTCTGNVTSGTAGQVAFYSATGQAVSGASNLTWDNTNIKLALSSSTPFATLSVNPVSGGASNQFVVGSSSATSFIINNNGNVGIGGTTTPVQVFSVLGNGYLTGGLGVGIATTSAGVIQNTGNAYHGGLVISTGAGTSTFSGALQSTYLNLTGTAATSTFGNGISIANGCYAIANACLATGGSGTVNNGTAGQIAYYSASTNAVGGASNLTWDNTNVKFALSSSTPFATLSVNPISGGASNQFVVGSSSATALIINNNGNVGIGGTTTAAQVFSVVGNGYFTGGLGAGIATTSAGVLQTTGNIYSAGLVISTGAGTSTFSGGIQGTYLNLTGASATSTAANGINLSAGCFSINNTCVGGTGGSGTVSSGSTGQLAYYAAGGTTVSGISNLIWDNSNTRLGIGTTTPWSRLSVAGAAGGTDNLFVISTSTAAFATTTVLSVDSNGITTFGSGAEGDSPVQFGVDNNAWTMGYLSSDKTFRIASSTTLTSNVYFTITKPGFFGISSTTPYGKFSINPDGIGTGPEFVIGSSTKTDLLITNTGLVGIGSTSPATRLGLAGNAYLDSNVITISSSSAASLILSLQSKATTTILNAVDNAFSFATSSANVPIFSISTRSSPVGLIGIGTSSPWGKLSIEMGTFNPAFVVSNTGSSTPSFIVTGVNQNGAIGIATTSPYRSAALAIGLSSTTPGLVIGVNGSSTPALIVSSANSNGTVGIASSTPNGSYAFVAGGSTYIGTGATNSLVLHVGTINMPVAATTTINNTINGWSISTTTTNTAGENPVISVSSNSSTSTIGFFVSTSTGLVSGSGLGLPSTMKNQLIVGNGKVQANLLVVNGGLCVDTDGWCTASSSGIISANVAVQVGHSDLAEIYDSIETLEPGELVAPAGQGMIHKAQASAQDVMGVVSTAPGLILGQTSDSIFGPHTYPIALTGRVPVKVSLENGPIHAGDYLAPALLDGYAAKATNSGVSIGQALEDYNGSDKGTVLMMMRIGYFSAKTNQDGIKGLTLTQASSMGTALLAELTSSQPTVAATSTHTKITADQLAAALEVVSPNVITQGLVVDSISSVDKEINFKSDMVFFGRPFFTTDTAGFAKVSQGHTRVDVTFDRDYIEQPIVNTSLSFDDASSTNPELAIFSNNIQYVITKKSTKGFTIVLNKAAPEDLNFSWTAFAVKNAKVFTSKADAVTPITQPQTQPVTQPNIPDQTASVITGVPIVSATTTPPDTNPATTTSSTDQGSTLPQATTTPTTPVVITDVPPTEPSTTPPDSSTSTTSPSPDSTPTP
jgi:hypothetical protein